MTSEEQLLTDVRTREILRHASVALENRVVTLWRISPEGEALPQVASEVYPGYHATSLDVQDTLGRWGAPIGERTRWVGCRLDIEGRWCVAPVRADPPTPPPGGRERRSRERMTLELAGLCVGLMERAGRLAEEEVDGPRAPGAIAHEVANPLAAARATLEVCMSAIEHDAGTAPEARAAVLGDLSAAVREIERAAAFLRSVSDRARGARPRTERFDAVAVLRSCVTLEQPLARARASSLEFDSLVERVYLDGDPNGLYQILVNLVRNAVDASQGRDAPVRVRVDQQGEVVHLMVRDQGVGIPAEHLSRIFEPGFTTKAVGSGSGMGLAVVRDVAQDMFGGSVQVESVVGAGTVVTVSLPVPRQRRSDELPAE